MSAPPLLVLGVRRSGTTLLRVVLDRHSELAVPDESYFVPQLADRHGGRIDADGFVDDLRRLPTLREWGVSADAVRARLRPGMGLGEAVGAVYEAYADGLGKSRWGDKTPMYMQHLPLLERLFPTARYVHLVRDGRDAGLSFLAMPRGIVTESWGHPRTPGGFACQWRSEVRAAQALGGRVGKRYLEVSYEELVADSAAVVERICAFAGLPYEPAMLEYEGTVDVSAKPHQQRLRQAPTPGVRDWREDMAPEDVTAFEAVAGDLLAELGYETATRPAAAARARGRAALAAYAARTAA
ncbi:MAG: sulfotransferase family protein, partial [Gaiellaceae bacterium]